MTKKHSGTSAPHAPKVCIVCGVELNSENATIDDIECDRCLLAWKERSKMKDHEFLAALRRMRDRIADGIELVAVDSEEIGNKYTHCSWGMCSEDREQWPDRELHIFKEDFDSYGRISTKNRLPWQPCPFDKRKRELVRDGNIYSLDSGCFWTCMIFQGATGAVSVELALTLYDEAIARFRAFMQAGDEESHE